MYTQFGNLEEDKQERIINAAIKEFVRNGFDRASTNEIIKLANISKGSLFKYFNSKKELYLFLCDYVINKINMIYKGIDLEETDFIKRVKDVAYSKLKIMRKFPLAFDFLKSVAHEESKEIRDEIENIIRFIINDGFDKIYMNIDLTQFRDDIDIEKTINIINWSMLSLAERERDSIDTYNSMDEQRLLSEFEGYLEIMKQCFYKKQ